ncbi:unnamed protein product, partial [Candidula unifasciata]
TLGQLEQWDVHNPTTFQHPMVPYDVLVHPLSLPSHPLLVEREFTHDIIHQDSVRDDKDQNIPSVSPQVDLTAKPASITDDDTIKAMLRERSFGSATGK